MSRSTGSPVTARLTFEGSLANWMRGRRLGRLYWGDDTMDRLKMLALRLLRDEEGQDLIEYALLATFVSLVAIAGATLLGTALNNWYGTVATEVNTAAAGAS